MSVVADIQPPDAPLAFEVHRRIQAIRQAYNVVSPVPDFRAHVRRLVVVSSSSRGGSSIFAEILRRTPQLLHIRGEVNPFFRLNGLSYPENGITSDALEARSWEVMACPATNAVTGSPGNRTSTRTAASCLDALSRDLSYDCGTACAELASEVERWRFAVALCCRLTMQWPQDSFAPDEIHGLLLATLKRLEVEAGWAPGELRDLQLFHVLFLQALRESHPCVSPYYYDLDRTLIAQFFPDVPVDESPPSETVIEEPPFIPISPWRPASEQELLERTVVIKTPSLNYRMEFLETLFPNAEMRVLHLTRNVLATVNGLYDGWQYPGFFSHRVHLPLKIAGYSERIPGVTDRWWKFDLPPGWESWTARRLEEVCCFQWLSACRAIETYLEARPEVRATMFRLRFEDVIGRVEVRLEAFRGLVSWLGIGLDERLSSMLRGELPPVMATARPRQRRWFRRVVMLQPLLEQPGILDMMKRIGYELDPETWG